MTWLETGSNRIFWFKLKKDHLLLEGAQLCFGQCIGLSYKDLSFLGSNSKFTNDLTYDRDDVDLRAQTAHELQVKCLEKFFSRFFFGGGELIWVGFKYIFLILFCYKVANPKNLQSMSWWGDEVKTCMHPAKRWYINHRQNLKYSSRVCLTVRFNSWGMNRIGTETETEIFKIFKILRIFKIFKIFEI